MRMVREPSETVRSACLSWTKRDVGPKRASISTTLPSADLRPSTNRIARARCYANQTYNDIVLFRRYGGQNPYQARPRTRR